MSEINRAPLWLGAAGVGGRSIVPAVELRDFSTYYSSKHSDKVFRRRAENKVRMADPILRADIKVLARMNSQLLDDAIILRSAQLEHGYGPAA